MLTLYPWSELALSAYRVPGSWSNSPHLYKVKDCWFVGSLGSWEIHLFSMCCYGKMMLDTYHDPVVPHHTTYTLVLVFMHSSGLFILVQSDI